MSSEPIQPLRVEYREPLLAVAEPVLEGEGGSITKGVTRAGEPCVVVNESALMDLLDEEDQMDAIKCYLFASEAERDQYIQQRWSLAIQWYRERLSRG
ncbi:hypothetical protein [Aestuariirhabdus litorea]|uniref:Uncharacterized protein n=1 Tax=Aestuariirhabdus litorea TaxID=2528527 RepID=A0A3P3VJC7_9GAMM|nr:hypothetical protein [Aestuariirhabdus litorea]RRJ82825.1 hypothetical protein D0544_13320 [Aestuariirhabdus litorea]RWW92984.1 hypothetical protein DZC74_13295 [Endozoicomonadaceae bacterium GTF-13]